jgi:hypothetical protein
VDETRSMDCRHRKFMQNLGRRDHRVDMVMCGSTILQWVLKEREWHGVQWSSQLGAMGSGGQS